VYPPERVAETIVRLMAKPQREVYVGGAGRCLSVLHTMLPSLAERLLAAQVEKQHFQDQHAEPSWGNLFAPMPQENRLYGGWNGTHANSRRRLRRAGLVAAGLLVAGWMWYRKQPRRQHWG
jgi:hypothetical protein